MWSENLLPAVAVGGGAALLYLLFAPDKRHRAIRGLPCPASTLPLLGNTLDLMFFELHRLHDWIFEQCLVHGGKPWRLQALGAPPLIVVSSVAAFEDVLKTHFEIFDKGPRMNMIFRDIMGEGIFAVDGEQWKQQRKALTHLFTMRRFRESINGAIHKHLLQFGSVLDRVVDKHSGHSVNELFSIGDAFHAYAFDTFSAVAFGLEHNTLEEMAFPRDGQPPNEFLTACTDSLKLLELRFHQPDWLWQLKRALNVGHERELKQAMDAIDRRVHEVVARTLERRATAGNGDHHHDVLSLMMEHMDEFKHGDTRKLAKFLRDIGFAMMAAGKDTTGTTLTWVLIMLGRYPHVLAKVREELHATLPQLFTDRSFVPSMNDAEHSLVYLEAVVRETMRLYPLLPLNAKEANADVTLSDGTHVKKGSRVYIPSYALGRMPSVWGDDAGEFKPERWLSTPTTLRTVSSFQFISFHAGPRICLGMRFAMVQVKATLAYLLSKFDFELERPASEYSYELASILSIKGPVKVRLSKLTN